MNVSQKLSKFGISALFDEPKQPAAGRTPPEGAARPPAPLSKRNQAAKRIKEAPLDSRSLARRNSNAIKRLKEMVGSSPKVYTNILEVVLVKFMECEALYSNLKEGSYCALRSQLVMALHDDLNDVRFKDKCHELAWTLDAVLQRKGFSEQHMAKLKAFFAPYIAHSQRMQGGGGRRGSGGGVDERDRRTKRQREGGIPGYAGYLTDAGIIDAEESTGGRSGAEDAKAGDKTLGEAGMILADPPALHLLAAEAVAQLHACVTTYKVPSENEALLFVLRLMYLAVGSKKMLRDGKYFMPQLDTDVLLEAWPQLAILLADAELDTAPADDPDRVRRHSTPEGWQLLKHRMGSDAVLRKVVQMLVLDCLAAADLVTAHLLLLGLSEMGHWRGRSGAMLEYAPFAYSLACTLQDMTRGDKLSPASGLWRTGFEAVLLQLVDSDAQVHHEVLRLLLQVAKKVPAPTMAQYLDTMVVATRGSREKARSQKQKYASIAAQYAAEAVQMPGFISGGQSEWSDGFSAVRSLKYGTNATYSDLYHKLITITPVPRDQVTPRVSEFLQQCRREQEEAAAQRAADCISED